MSVNLQALSILPYSKKYIESKQKEYLGNSILFGIGSVFSLGAAVGFGFAAYQGALTITPWLDPNKPGNLIYMGSAQYSGSLLVFGPLGIILIMGLVLAYASIPAIPIAAGIACLVLSGYSAYRCYAEASKYSELKNSFTSYNKTEFDKSLAEDFAADKKSFDQAFEVQREVNRVIDKLIFKYTKKQPEEAVIRIKNSVIEQIKQSQIITVEKLKYYDFSRSQSAHYKSRELAELLQKAMLEGKLTEADIQQNPNIFKHITQKTQNVTTVTGSLTSTNLETHNTKSKPEFSFDYDGLYNCRMEIYSLLKRKELLKDKKIVEFDYSSLESLVKRETGHTR